MAQVFESGASGKSVCRAQSKVEANSVLVVDAECAMSNVGWVPYDKLPVRADKTVADDSNSAAAVTLMSAVIAHMGLFVNPCARDSTPGELLHQLVSCL